MPISGLVLVTNPDFQAEQLRALLDSIDCVSPGPAEGSKIAIVTETADKDADKDLWHRLQRMPGVCHIDVAFIHFDENEAQGCVSSSHYGALQ